MDDAVIAGRYAKALFEVGHSKGEEDHLIRDLDIAAPILANLKNRLNDPGLSVEKKKALLSQELKGLVSPLAIQFFSLLIEKRRFSLWPLISPRFSAICADKKNKMRAHIVTARALDDLTRSKLTSQLEKFSGKNIELKVQEDPSLIGGIVVRLGDWVMDSSLRGRLKRMKETFNGN